MPYVTKLMRQRAKDQATPYVAPPKPTATQMLSGGWGTATGEARSIIDRELAKMIAEGKVIDDRQ